MLIDILIATGPMLCVWATWFILRFIQYDNESEVICPLDNVPTHKTILRSPSDEVRTLFVGRYMNSDLLNLKVLAATAFSSAGRETFLNEISQYADRFSRTTVIRVAKDFMENHVHRTEFCLIESGSRWGAGIGGYACSARPPLRDESQFEGERNYIVGISRAVYILPYINASAADHEFIHLTQHACAGVFDHEWASFDSLQSDSPQGQEVWIGKGFRWFAYRMWIELQAQVIGSPLVFFPIILLPLSWAVLWSVFSFLSA